MSDLKFEKGKAAPKRKDQHDYLIRRLQTLETRRDHLPVVHVMDVRFEQFQITL